MYRVEKFILAVWFLLVSFLFRMRHVVEVDYRCERKVPNFRRFSSSVQFTAIKS